MYSIGMTIIKETCESCGRNTEEDITVNISGYYGRELCEECIADEKESFRR